MSQCAFAKKLQKYAWRFSGFRFRVIVGAPRGENGQKDTTQVNLLVFTSISERFHNRPVPYTRVQSTLSTREPMHDGVNG